MIETPLLAVQFLFLYSMAINFFLLTLSLMCNILRLQVPVMFVIPITIGRKLLTIQLLHRLSMHSLRVNMHGQTNL